MPSLAHGDWLRQLLVKSDRWKYENEFRLIAFNDTDFPVKLKAGVITRVILGCKMSDSDKEDILHSILKLDDSIKVEIATKLKDRFGLTTKRIMY